MSFLFAAIRDQPFTLHSPERSLTDDAACASPSGPMGEIPRANGTFRKAAIQSGDQPGQHCNHDGPLVERPCRRLGLDSKSVAATGVRYPYAGSLRFAEAAIVSSCNLPRSVSISALSACAWANPLTKVCNLRSRGAAVQVSLLIRAIRALALAATREITSASLPSVGSCQMA